MLILIFQISGESIFKEYLATWKTKTQNFKTTIKYIFSIPCRSENIKVLTISNATKGAEQLEFSYISGDCVSWYSHFRIKLGIIL